MAGNVKWYGKEIIKKISDANKQIISKACLIVEREAKILCPVDTGRLRSSISHEIEGITGRVGSNVEYAAAVELGTEKQSPQPYLRPALHKNEKKILELFKKII